MSILSTPINLWQQAFAADATDTAFPALVNTLTEPAEGTGVIIVPTTNCGRDAMAGGGLAPNTILIQPYGTNSSNDAIDMRVTGWTRYVVSSTVTEWVPTTIAQYAILLGASTGASGGLGTSKFFADTITATFGPMSNDPMSNALDVHGAILLDTLGCEKLQITFDLGSGASGANALIRWL